MTFESVFGNLEGIGALVSCIGVVEDCGSKIITNLESFWRYKALNLMALYDRSSLGHDLCTL